MPRSDMPRLRSALKQRLSECESQECRNQVVQDWFGELKREREEGNLNAADLEEANDIRQFVEDGLPVVRTSQQSPITSSQKSDYLIVGLTTLLIFSWFFELHVTLTYLRLFATLLIAVLVVYKLVIHRLANWYRLSALSLGTTLVAASLYSFSIQGNAEFKKQKDMQVSSELINQQKQDIAVFSEGLRAAGFKSAEGGGEFGNKNHPAVTIFQLVFGSVIFIFGLFYPQIDAWSSNRVSRSNSSGDI